MLWQVVLPTKLALQKCKGGKKKSYFFISDNEINWILFIL